MLQHYSTSHYTHFNTRQNTKENQPHCSKSYLDNYPLQQGRPTSHVPPLPSSALCSNDHKFSSFSDSSVPSNMKYHHQQQLDYRCKQYDDVEQQQQTLSADQIQSLTAPTTSVSTAHSLIGDKEHSPSNIDDFGDTSSLVDLSRRLRANLSLAKRRMMMDLKQSTEPNDIAIYTQLESITLDDPSSSPSYLYTLPPPKTKASLSSPLTKANQKLKTSSSSATAAALPRIVTSTVISKTVGNGRNLFSHHTQYPQSSKMYNRHRVHKKKPYNSNSSYMELQTNSNGFVSVVLRKKSASTSKDSFATLTRSFSFNIGDGDDSDSDTDSDSDDDDNTNNNINSNNSYNSYNSNSSISSNSSNIINNGDDCVPPATPAFDLSCDGDTEMSESTPSFDPLITIAPGAITTNYIPNTLNPMAWSSPSSTATMGFSTNEHGLGMNWNMNMMELLSPTWMEDMEYAWQQQGNQLDENKHLGLEQQPDENAIDSWLQRGGFGYGPLVAASDQELADLLDFD